MGEHLRNIKLTIAFEGTNYCGFQSQINAVAVQDVLTRGLQKIFGGPITLFAASRTDTGVHAYGQVVNVHTSGSIAVNRIVKAAATVLPRDITVVDAVEIYPDFHARKHAIKKTYQYRIRTGKRFDPFLRNLCWQMEYVLDISKMNEAVACLIGEHDFRAFCSIKSTVKTTIRKIYAAEWQQNGDEAVFTICGNGFLYNMVRIIVGTAVDVGRNRLPVADFERILTGRDRGCASPTAPAQGLYLMKVEYEEGGC